MTNEIKTVTIGDITKNWGEWSRQDYYDAVKAYKMPDTWQDLPVEKQSKIDALWGQCQKQAKRQAFRMEVVHIMSDGSADIKNAIGTRNGFLNDQYQDALVGGVYAPPKTAAELELEKLQEARRPKYERLNNALVGEFELPEEDWNNWSEEALDAVIAAAEDAGSIRGADRSIVMGIQQSAIFAAWKKVAKPYIKEPVFEEYEETVYSDGWDSTVTKTRRIG